jgi:hypothetical protein
MGETNGCASAEQLLASVGKARRYKNVSLPACGLTVRIQSLKERELSWYGTQVVSKTGRGNVMSRIEDATRRLLVLCMVDDAGNRLFTDTDTDKLRDWDSLDTQTLYNEITPHVGLGRDDIETMVKNSPATPAESSPSD